MYALGILGLGGVLVAVNAYFLTEDHTYYVISAFVGPLAVFLGMAALVVPYEPDAKKKVPQTGLNLLRYILAAILSAAGLTTGVVAILVLTGLVSLP